jgi:hypothetical protein
MYLQKFITQRRNLNLKLNILLHINGGNILIVFVHQLNIQRYDRILLSCYNYVDGTFGQFLRKGKNV